MKRITAIGLAYLALSFAGAGASAGELGPGVYHGYVAVDRWGQKVFHTGPYHLFLSDEVYEKLKDRTGQSLRLTVSQIDQPMNPGAGMIRAFSKVEEKGPSPNVEVTATCPRTRVKAGEGAELKIRINNIGTAPVTLFPGAFAAILVTRDGPSPKGYKDPDDGAYWYYQYTYRGHFGEEANPLRVACRRVILGPRVERMLVSGLVVLRGARGWDKVILPAKADLVFTARVGKLLPPGDYQVFAWYSTNNFSHSSGPMSSRIDIKVQAADRAE